jgi:hypothetical protein
MKEMTEADVLAAIQHLHVLAWGDTHIVEDALAASLQRVYPVWWKFWSFSWEVNWAVAEQYVLDHVADTNSIQTVDHDSLNI